MLFPNWQKESWQTFEEISGYVRPERVNKWPNSMTDIWWWWWWLPYAALGGWSFLWKCVIFSVLCRLNIYINFRSVSPQPLAAETQVQSWVNQHEICGGQIGIGTDLSLRSPIFSVVIGLYLWWTLKTYLHCTLMTLCTQIWTHFITNSFSLN